MAGTLMLPPLSRRIASNLIFFSWKNKDFEKMGHSAHADGAYIPSSSVDNPGIVGILNL